MIINFNIKPEDLKPAIDRMWALSGAKISSIHQHYDERLGSPVFTMEGKYTTRGWTEWTQGFQYGSAILQYEATGDTQFLEIGKEGVKGKMAPHLTHTGVHDHGFNNVSTYGNLLRLAEEGTIDIGEWEKEFYRLALKVSGTVQANRWSNIRGHGGFLYSFNGPQSLFVDTIRSVRILMLSHFMGHHLQGENDVIISMFERGLHHIAATARYNVYYGEGRDSFDEWGRTAHECLFNVNDGRFRAPNAQQGFSGFTTWTRGLAWALCGFAEELEFLQKVPGEMFPEAISKTEIIGKIKKGAQATADFYIKNTSSDGIPLWDTGGPNVHLLEDFFGRAADPYNNIEPLDASAAAIAAQGLVRLGLLLDNKDYLQAGLTTTETLLSDRFLSLNDQHQGLLLHSVYHYPNGWDFIPEGMKVPCGESSMWGDYHLRELALLLGRMIDKKPLYAFYNCLPEYKNV